MLPWSVQNISNLSANKIHSYYYYYYNIDVQQDFEHGEEMLALGFRHQQNT